MLIQDIDFSQLYKDHMARAGRVTKPSCHWDSRAEKMAESCANPHDEYLVKFLSLMDLNGAKTLLDVGCGPGTICLPLADQLQQVYALDYSAGMLKVAGERAKASGVNNITLIQRAWDDNWDDIPECDIVVASRSTLVADMAEALKKLNQKARLRVYTTHTVNSHFIDPAILEAIGRRDPGLPTYIYPLNILHQMGIQPRLEYIESRNCQARVENYPAFEQAVSWSLGELSEIERQRLQAYYAQRIRDNQPLISSMRSWAFISWNKF